MHVVELRHVLHLLLLVEVHLLLLLVEHLLHVELLIFHLLKLGSFLVLHLDCRNFLGMGHLVWVVIHVLGFWVHVVATRIEAVLLLEALSGLFVESLLFAFIILVVLLTAEAGLSHFILFATHIFVIVRTKHLLQ
jgi:hypothetical protein